MRLVAATHHDLAERMREGAFRRDLYYRVSVVPLEMPPLRERASDILILARLLLAQCCTELGRPETRLSPSAERALVAYSLARQHPRAAERARARGAAAPPIGSGGRGSGVG